MNWEKCPYIEKVFKIGGQFYPAIIGQFYAAIDIVTAFPLEMYRELCFKAGADDFLTKPVKIEELRASIDHYAQKDAISELEPIALI